MRGIKYILAISIAKVVTVCRFPIKDGQIIQTDGYGKRSGKIAPHLAKQSIEHIVTQACRELDEEFSCPLDAIGIATVGVVCGGVDEQIEIARDGWETQFSPNDILKGLPHGWRTPKTEIRVCNDITAFAIAERHRRAGQGDNFKGARDVLAYVYVGGGVNAGIALNGFPYTSDFNPELGHIPAPYMAKFDNTVLACQHHKNCVEGRIAKGALFKRFDVPSGSYDDLWKNREAITFVAEHLAYLCTVLLMSFSPNRIVIGPHADEDDPEGKAITVELLAATQGRFLEMAADYPQEFTTGPKTRAPGEREVRDVEDFITSSKLDRHGRIVGATILAAMAVNAYRIMR